MRWYSLAVGVSALNVMRAREQIMTQKQKTTAAVAAELPRFGTDGWRAVIAEQFTFKNVRLIAAAMARYIRDKRGGSRTVAVGYDTRFMSKEFAVAVAEAAAACGVEVLLSRGFCPTPALTFAVKQKKLAGGIMITASHNPYTYNGVKFKSAYGGPALVEETQAIERHMHEIASAPEKARRPGGSVREIDLLPAYYKQIERYVDVDVIRRFRGRIVFNPMLGAGIGSVDGFLRLLGVKVTAINDEPNPLFGGGGPEPILQNLQDQVEAIRAGKAVLGLATDGDADRFGVLDEDGGFVQLHDLMPLLFAYLVETRGFTGGVVRSSSMADTVDRVAARYGRKVVEVPVGFKNVCEKMMEIDTVVGGEESGGFGYKKHMPERDGVLSCLLLVEMLAARSITIKQAIARLRNDYGPFAYGRIDRHFPIPQLKANFTRLKTAPPGRFGGVAVDRVSLADGVKFYFADGSWMLMRCSDTEPLGRIYVASSSDAAVKRILNAGAAELFKAQ